jgi:hypothetical protein
LGTCDFHRSQYQYIAWAGSAMFAAFAVGVPIGSSLYGRSGFAESP